MKKRLRKILPLLLPVMFLSWAFMGTMSVHAVDVQKEFAETLFQAGLVAEADVGDIPTLGDPINALINSVLALAGVGILALIIYAGFMWAFAAGNAEKVKKAQQIIIGGVLGLIIIFSAYAIANFVLSALSKASTG